MAYNEMEMDSELKKIYTKLKVGSSLNQVINNLEDAMHNFSNIKNQEFESNNKEAIIALVEKISSNYERIKASTEGMIKANNMVNTDLLPTLEELDQKITQYNEDVREVNTLNAQLSSLRTLERKELGEENV